MGGRAALRIPSNVSVAVDDVVDIESGQGSLETTFVAMEDGERLAVKRQCSRDFLRGGQPDGLQVTEQASVDGVHVAPNECTWPPYELVEHADPADVTTVNHVVDIEAVKECHRLTHNKVLAVTV